MGEKQHLLGEVLFRASVGSVRYVYCLLVVFGTDRRWETGRKRERVRYVSKMSQAEPSIKMS